jgi:RNA polymerase sigma factor (sigma-70 family)
MIAIADKVRAAELTRDSSALFNLHTNLAKKLAASFWSGSKPVRRVMEFDDLHQIALMALHVASKRYEDPSQPFPAFASSCILNALIDALRRGANVDRPAPMDDWVAQDAERSLEPDEREMLGEALAGLSSEHRRTVARYYGLSGVTLNQEEIARREGVTKSAISQRLAAARGLLRGQLLPPSD